MQPGNNSRDGRTETVSQWGSPPQQRRARAIQTSSRKTTMDDLHNARPKLRNKRTGKGSTIPNSTFTTEAEASTTLPQRHAELQDDDQNNCATTTQRSNWPQHLCRCWLGRLPINKKINNRIDNDPYGINSTIWKQNTSSGSTILCRIRALRNRRGSTRSTTCNELHQRSNEHKGQHSHTHRLNKRKKYCDKNWLIKESQTHWPKIPLRAAIGTQWNTFHSQDQYSRQSSRHTHKVCLGRCASQAPLQHWPSGQTMSTPTFPTMIMNTGNTYPFRHNSSQLC